MFENQLAFRFPDDGRLTVTRDLARHRLCNGLLKKLHYVRRYFPELEGMEIRVGITRSASGMAVPGGDEIWFNPSRLSYHTISHELTHLLQGTHGIPTGERSCDLYSLARHWTLNDAPPAYVHVPVDMCDTSGRIPPSYAKALYALAREALELRERGIRNYISYFEKTLQRVHAGACTP